MKCVVSVGTEECELGGTSVSVEEFIVVVE